MEKDILNQNLKIGDFCLVVEKHYRNLVLAKVLDFTAKNVRVLYINYNNRKDIYLTNQVVKIALTDTIAFPVEKVILLQRMFEEETNS